MNLPSINPVPFILLCVWGPRAAAALEKKHGGVRVSSKVGKPTTILTVLFSQVLPKKKIPSAQHAWDGLGTYHISGVLDFLPLKISSKSLIHSQKNMFLS